MRVLRRGLALLLFAVALLGPPAAWAHEPDEGPILDRVQKALGLSAEQVKALAPVLGDYQKQHDQRMEQFRSRMRTVLTPKQAADFDELRKKRRLGKGGQKRGIKALQEALGLSEDQVTRIRGMAKETREQGMREYQGMLERVKGVLTPEQYAQFEQMTRRRDPSPGPTP